MKTLLTFTLLIEEFKRCIMSGVILFLDDRKIKKKMAEVARLVDNCVLTRKVSSL